MLESRHLECFITWAPKDLIPRNSLLKTTSMNPMKLMTYLSFEAELSTKIPLILYSTMLLQIFVLGIMAFLATTKVLGHGFGPLGFVWKSRWEEREENEITIWFSKLGRLFWGLCGIKISHQNKTWYFFLIKEGYFNCLLWFGGRFTNIKIFSVNF